MKYQDLQHMSKKVKSKIIPKLRFPEFKGADGWYETQLGQCLKQHPDYGVNAPAVPYSTILPTYLRITDISGEGKFLPDQKMSVDEEKVTDDSYLEEGDIVLARTGASVGKSYKYRIEDGKLVFAGFLIRVKPDEKKLNSELLAQFLNTSQYWRWVDFISTRSGQPGINGNEYSSMPLLLPSTLKEQQKIADCLSFLDEVITAQNQKLETLKFHKKGLMEQLFPAKGETVPKLRFKEFKNSGQWEKKNLGDMTEKVGSGVTPFGGEANYRKSGRPFVRSQNVGWGIFLLGDIAFIDEHTHQSSISTEIEIDDVLLNITGASIGRSAVANVQVQGGNVNQHVCIIRTVKTTLSPFFLNQYLISSYGQEQIDSFQAGGNRQGLNFAQIRSFSISLPPKIEEQQKIADCLSSLDELITGQNQKLETLKTHKIGLMQQLFPKVTD